MDKDKAKKPIESFGASPAVYAGVCAYKGWADGKMVTKAEFDAAVKQYLNAPAGSCRGGGK